MTVPSESTPGSKPSADATAATRSASGRDGRDDATAFYDRWAGLYDPVASHAPCVGRLRRRAIDALRLERGDTVIEVGCGTGANLPLLARVVGPTGTVIGIDRSRGVLERARRRARSYPQIEVLRADGTKLPLGSDRVAISGERDAGDTGVDGVLATFVVGMLEDPAAAVEDWIDHLAPGGHVALLHLRRSEHAIAPIANRALRLFTICSTPPTGKLRYERDLSGVLDQRVRAAGDAVRDRTAPTLTESHLFDLVELTAGRRG
ncbi:hypothetical protein GCM10028857_12340 [Salinarchaeum chitinilyticum]